MKYDYPIAVAIAAIVHENNILLIKRVKDGFEGCWSLPGGKVKVQEHVSETVVWEVKEETGIDADFVGHLGYVSEHQVYGDEIKHVILHVCELAPKNRNIVEKEHEGALGWFLLDDIDTIRDDMIPSDYHMIKQMVQNRSGGYYNCVIDVTDDGHQLRKFYSAGDASL